MFFDYGPILLVQDILKEKQNPYKQPGRIVLRFINTGRELEKGHQWNINSFSKKIIFFKTPRNL